MNVKSIDLTNWSKERIRFAEIEKYLDNNKDFINDQELTAILESQRPADSYYVRDIINKALAIQTLTLKETATLLNVQSQDLWEEMRVATLKIKKKVYDNRIVTFAPLYTGNFCFNNCLYCGFRKDNSAISRKLLAPEEIKRETEILAGLIGHKRIIAVYGEHPLSDIDYIVSTMDAIYKTRVKTKTGYSSIRRINVNAPPLSVEELMKLRAAGIGTYQVFQETYHHKTYEFLHPQGTIKANYQWRLYSMHRAFTAGIDDVGIGVLFGLYDWRFEVLGLLRHAQELEKIFGVGPHTVSFPRLEPAINTPFAENSEYKVSDDDFKKIITVLRLAIPYTGMILTARENSQIRKECVSLGITQTDASTRIGIGSYSNSFNEQEEKKQQFLLGDTRSLDEVVREFAQMGYITSFCTAGYRCNRTGQCIMELLKNGQEGKFCKLNAVLTFREWIDDFAGKETKIIAENIINKEIEEIKEKMPFVFPKFKEYYERIKRGERDLYF
jgi:2-iminoacetate synthase